MQKKSFSYIKILLTTLLFVCLGVINCFCLQFKQVEAQQKEFLFATTTQSAVKSINGFSASYVEQTTSTELSSLSFEKEYTGSEYKLEIQAQATDLSNFGYKWFYSKDNSSFSEVTNQTESSISLKDCNQSGYYYCQVYEIGNESNFENAEVVNFKISPKTVTISNITADSKEFDDTKIVTLKVSLNGIIDSDGVSAQGNGHVLNANAEEEKYVYVDEVYLIGLNKDNYVLDDTYNKPVFANITKIKTDLIWETSDGETVYNYTGVDMSSKVSAYYYNVKGQKIQLAYSIKGNAIGMAYNYLNEFVNAGAYTFTAILTENEKNYLLTDNSGDMTFSLSINKVNPVVTIQNTEFTYNGLSQDAKGCVVINNNEQSLMFENNTFTTVEQANNTKVKVSALESQNYFAFEKEFSVTMLKANSNIDISNVIKEYVYNGSLQTVDQGAIIDNSEQELKYLNNSFTTVNQGNRMIVTVYAPESANYNYSLKSFEITVAKADISTVGWSWNYTGDYTYNGKLQSVNVINYNKDLVYPYYVDASFINAGTYTAKVNFYLNDYDNYNPVDFDDIVWTIKKATIAKPNIVSYQTTYNGQNQTFPVSANEYYKVENYEHKNAGVYNVIISLKDTLNIQWEGGDSSSIIVDWTINKITISKPNEKIKLEYNGQTQSLNLEGSNNYTIINGSAKEVGNYKSYLVLNDTTNYKWAGTDSAYVTIDWEITSDTTFNAVPVIVIIIVSIILVLAGVYITLHFTVINKKKGKKREVKK